MRITCLLTAYNRPVLLGKAIKSIADQTHLDWNCILMDDGSGVDNLELYKRIVDPRFTVLYYNATQEMRDTTARYAVNINKHLPGLSSGLVCYMTDNTEYDRHLFSIASKWFENNHTFAGYAISQRDCYTAAGEYLGISQKYGHWANMPPLNFIHTFGAALSPRRFLDHSQVCHRLPVGVAWDESAKPDGDAVFFERLISQHGAICPMYHMPLLTEHIVELH